MAKKYCPVCGLKRIEEAVFCPNCGNRFERNEEAEKEQEKIYQTQVYDHNGSAQTVLVKTEKIQSQSQSLSQSSDVSRKELSGGDNQGYKQNNHTEHVYGQRFYPKHSSRAGKVVEYADFGDRFVAFLIDSLILSIVGGLIFWGSYGEWVISTFVGLSYFILMEMHYNGGGQTFGKKAMNIRTVDAKTLEPIDGRQAIIHSFGKVLFLPIDLILGWIMNEDEDEENNREEIRLTQRLAQTVVIKE